MKVDSAQVLKATREALHTLMEDRLDSGRTLREALTEYLEKDLSTSLKRDVTASIKVIVESDRPSGLLEISVSVREESTHMI
jgi:hypothetical protein